MGNAWSSDRRSISRPQVCEERIHPPEPPPPFPPTEMIISGTIEGEDNLFNPILLIFEGPAEQQGNAAHWILTVGSEPETTIIEIKSSESGGEIEGTVVHIVEFVKTWQGKGTKMNWESLDPASTGNITITATDGTGGGTIEAHEE